MIGLVFQNGSLVY